MYGHPYFVRIGSGGGENWLREDHPLPAKLALNELKVKGIGVSTYLVQSDVEEAIAAGAHLFTKSRPKAESCYVLRIRFSDLREAGITYSDVNLGSTGVVWVDYAHHDLVGDQDQMSLLADVILRKIYDGQDRVRKLSIYQLTLCLRKIMELGVEDRPSMTAELCEKTLGVTTQREEHHTEECRNRREATIAELSRIQIPERVTRRRAYRIYQDRRSNAGTAEEDWFRALACLRAEYRNHFLSNALLTG